MATATKSRPAGIREIRPIERPEPAKGEPIFWTDEEKALVVERAIENRLAGMVHWPGLGAEIRAAMEALPRERRRPVSRNATGTFAWFPEVVKAGVAEAEANASQLAQSPPEDEPEPATSPPEEPEGEEEEEEKEEETPDTVEFETPPAPERAPAARATRRVYWDKLEFQAVIDEGVRLTLTGGSRGTRSLLAAAIQSLPEDRRRPMSSVTQNGIDWFRDGVEMGLREARLTEPEPVAAIVPAPTPVVTTPALAAWDGTVFTAIVAPARESPPEPEPIAAPEPVEEAEHDPYESLASMPTDSIVAMLLARLCSGRERESRLLTGLAVELGTLAARMASMESANDQNRRLLMRVVGELGGPELLRDDPPAPSPRVPEHVGTNGSVAEHPVLPPVTTTRSASIPRPRVLVIGLRQDFHKRLSSPFQNFATVKLIEDPLVAIRDTAGEYQHVMYTDQLSRATVELVRGKFPKANLVLMKSANIDRVLLEVRRVLGRS